MYGHRMANQPPYFPGQPPAAPPPQPKKGMSTCLIIAIVVGVLAVPVVGLMAVSAIYGVRRYLSSAKSAEAKNTVGAITRSAVAAYERESMAGSTTVHRLCKSTARVPAAPPMAAKYQPSPADGADFNTGDATTGWKCLKFAMNQPIYYAYKYETGAGSGKSGATASGFEASAQGDLDGNGVRSFFARGADVRNGAIVVSTELFIENEFE
jgi:type IV pilus assembly protein PilA